MPGHTNTDSWYTSSKTGYRKYGIHDDTIDTRWYAAILKSIGIPTPKQKGKGRKAVKEVGSFNSLVEKCGKCLAMRNNGGCRTQQTCTTPQCHLGFSRHRNRFRHESLTLRNPLLIICVLLLNYSRDLSCPKIQTHSSTQFEFMIFCAWENDFKW